MYTVKQFALKCVNCNIRNPSARYGVIHSDSQYTRYIHARIGSSKHLPIDGDAVIVELETRGL